MREIVDSRSGFKIRREIISNGVKNPKRHNLIEKVGRYVNINLQNFTFTLHSAVNVPAALYSLMPYRPFSQFY